MKKISKVHSEALSDIYCSARVLTEIVTLEDEKRKIKYLSPFAEPPNVAQQVSGVLLISYALANLAFQKNKFVDPASVCELVVWHDAPETRYGDLGRDQRRYVSINEEKTRSDMFGSVSWGIGVTEIIDKFEASGSDINTKLSRDADALYVIFTIRDLMDKGHYINQPEVRIQKTLKRMTTEEGFYLGEQMAAKTPGEIWKYLKKISGISGNKLSDAPKAGLATIVATSWVLFDLDKARSKASKYRLLALQELLGVGVKDKYIKQIVSDATNIYAIISTKRNAQMNNKKNPNYSGIIARLKTPKGRLLGRAVSEIDLYEWWQILMGYAVLTSGGKIEMKER